MNDTTSTAALYAGAARAALRAIVGPEHALTDPDQQLPYLREWRDMYEGRAGVVLRPGTTEEVSQILALAHASMASPWCRRPAIPAWSADRRRCTARSCCRSAA